MLHSIIIESLLCVLQTEPFWKLLFEVLYYLKYRTVDDIVIRAYSELSKGTD